MGLKQLDRRFRPLNTGRREVQLPVDSLGRERYRATIDARSIERGADGEPIGFTGHAATFGRRTWIGDKRRGFWEQVQPGAFNKSIKDGDVRFLVNHDPNRLLARTRSGTLRLTADETGLLSDADMAPVSYAQDLAILLERGDINSMSFAWPRDGVRDSWELAEDGKELRTLLEVPLLDVSVVTYPAYEDTDAGLRGLGFDVLSAMAGLDDEAQERLLRKIASGCRDEEFSVLVRSAALGLGRYQAPDNSEPAETTRDDTEDQPAETTGVPLDIRKRWHALRAGQLGLTA